MIVAPTASGKTALSIKLANECNGEVISSDSRQVYRKLDIGTEKVTKEEMAGVPHHLIDVADPETVYTATDFARDGQTAITDITARGNVPIVAGGTFFYVDALLGRTQVPEVPPNPTLRAELEQLSTEDLYAKLQDLDPQRADTIDPHNHRRIMRSIEIATALGHVPTLPPATAKYDVLMLGIETPREVLRERIRARAEQALTRGLIEETKQLLADGITRERLSEIGLEYRIIMEYIDGDLTDEQLIQKLEEKNWQYAKKQLSWLQRYQDIHWHPLDDYKDFVGDVRKWLST